MFALNTPITVEDGWARPAGPQDIVWGVVCGLVDTATRRVPVSKNGQPDNVVLFYYKPGEYDKDDDIKFVKLHKANKSSPAKKTKRIKKSSPKEAK